MPVRIQRSRAKGWKMPEDTIYVGRPTKWGNPFWHVLRFHGIERALLLYRNLFEGWNPSTVSDWPDGYVHQVYEDHSDFLKRLGKGHPAERADAELRGKNLACWCRLDQPCHADVLLEIANGPR